MTSRYRDKSIWFQNHSRAILFPDDCKKIQRMFWEIGYDLDLCCIQDFWEQRSEQWDAGWLDLPKSNEFLKKDIIKYIHLIKVKA